MPQGKDKAERGEAAPDEAGKRCNEVVKRSPSHREAKLCSSASLRGWCTGVHCGEERLLTESWFSWCGWMCLNLVREFEDASQGTQDNTRELRMS